MSDRVPWPAFFDGFKKDYVKGRRHAGAEHVVIIGPAGSGKTHLASEIAQLPPYMIVLDAKGYRDPSIKRFGFKRIERWPPPGLWWKVRSSDDPIRLTYAPRLSKPEDLLAMRVGIGGVLRDVFMSGGWSLYVDELQLLTDFRTRAGRSTGILLDDIIRVKRFEGVSVIASTQAPRYVPRSCLDQPTHCFFFRMRDRDTAGRMAEIGGADKRETIAEILALRPHEFLYIGPSGDMVRSKVVRKAA